MIIHGPYIGKDGRKRIIIIHEDGRRQFKSYPRFLLEQHLVRELTEEETVDHINDDFTDDRIENLQILTRSDNARKGMENRRAEIFKFICPECKKPGEKQLREIKHNRKQNKNGPFCSRKCAGIFNQRIKPGAGRGVRKGEGRRNSKCLK